jgi:hypothetical protein
MVSAERQRLNEADHQRIGWRRWGPYPRERQWGTVREAGLAGVSDDKQLLGLALALWNELDPMPKERLFGLTTARPS